MQQYVTCPRCGTQNYMGQHYCAGCGATMATSCPYCGAYMTSPSGFCTNCGAQAGGGMRQPGYPGYPGQQGQPGQPVRQHKPTSGWAIFGGMLFVLGVLCIVAGPVFIMTRPEPEQSTALLIRVIVIGGVGLIIGLPLMFKR